MSEINFNRDKVAGAKINKEWLYRHGADALKMRTEYAEKGNVGKFPVMFKADNAGGGFVHYVGRNRSQGRYKRVKEAERVLVEARMFRDGQAKVCKYCVGVCTCRK